MPSTSYFALTPHHFNLTSTPKHAPHLSHHFCPLTPPALSEPSIAPPSSSSQHPAVHRSFSSPKATTLLSQVALRSRAASDHGGSPNRALARERMMAEDDTSDDDVDEAALHHAMAKESASESERTLQLLSKHGQEDTLRPQNDHDMTQQNTHSEPTLPPPKIALRRQSRHDDLQTQAQQQQQQHRSHYQIETKSADGDALANTNQYISFPAFEHFYADTTTRVSSPAIQV